MPKPDAIWWEGQLDRLFLSEPAWKAFKIHWPYARRTYVVAEVGASWITPLRHTLTGQPMSSLEAAKAFVWMARYRGHDDASHGASAVKFQYWSNSLAVATKRRAVEFADRYERSRLPADFLPELAAEAQSLGLDFMCTTYMTEDIPVVAPWVKAFKIASFEVMDFDFIRAHLPYHKPIFLSLGLTTEAELTKLLELREELGRDTLKLIHCVSAYPCPYDQVQLHTITDYDLDGYSDHTGHPFMGAYAVMAGAKIIEVHIRSEVTGPDNPDYPHSLDPATFNLYIDNIDLAEMARGYGHKDTQPAEAANRQYMA